MNTGSANFGETFALYAMWVLWTANGKSPSRPESSSLSIWEPQHAVFQRDLYVFFLDLGDLGLNQVLCSRLANIHRRNPIGHCHGLVLGEDDSNGLTAPRAPERD